VIWAGATPAVRRARGLDLKKRYGIEVATGGNILPAMTAYKQFPGMEGALYYYFGIPKNPVNEWLVANHYKQFKSPPDFFTAGGMSAAIALVEAPEEDRRRHQHREADHDDGRHELRVAEGQDDLPQGRPSGDAEHVSLPHQGRPGVRLGRSRAGSRDQAGRDADPDQEQALIGGFVAAHGPAMLETKELTIRFGGHVAVDRVSCAFAPGTLTAIVGPNGAGKTTYFNLISGQLRSSAGSVWFDGVDITGETVPARTHRGLGRAFQLTQLFPNLSVARERSPRGAVAPAARPRPVLGVARSQGDAGRARALVADVRLDDRADAAASSLPHGDQRKLEVAMLMALEPSVFMFDEPTAGMSTPTCR
jgi:branched-chain amino acid transport system ATP-binding protein